MKSLSRDEIKKLAGVESNNFISIYVPTHRAGEAVTNGRDIIAFKNQVQQIKNKLVDTGMNESKAKDLLKEAYGLIEDSGFWHHQSDGLAVFIADNFFEYYTLPYQFQEKSILSTSAFHLKELLPAINGESFYFILALSLNQFRFFEATKHSIKRIELNDDVPASYDEAMRLTEVAASVQFRSKATAAGEGTIFHGHGSGKDDMEEYVLEEYLRQVEKGVFDVVKEETVPMVLIGTEEIKSLYRKANSYNHLTEESAEGNPDGFKPKEIHEKTLPVVSSYFQKKRDVHIKRYNELAGTGKASYDINTIVPAAANGRVDALFVSQRAHQWGKFQEKDQSVEVHDEYEEGDICLINKASVDTILNSGTTYVLNKEDLPEAQADTDMVAVLRF